MLGANHNAAVGRRVEKPLWRPRAACLSAGFFFRDASLQPVHSRMGRTHARHAVADSGQHQTHGIPQGVTLLAVGWSYRHGGTAGGRHACGRVVRSSNDVAARGAWGELRRWRGLAESRGLRGWRGPSGRHAAACYFRLP